MIGNSNGGNLSRLLCAGNGIDELPYGGCQEQIPHRHVHIELGLNPRYNASGQERIPPHFKQIRHHANGALLEHLFPDSGQLGFLLITGSNKLGLLFYLGV